MMYKITRIFWLSVLILVSLHLGIWSAGGEDKLPGMDLSGIHYKNGYLKVSVKNQNFHKVMQEVAKKSGVKIVINDSTHKDLSMDFDYTPLEKGIKRLLKRTNYVFFYRSEESGSLGLSSGLVTVLIFPKSGGWSMAGLGELAGDSPTYPDKQTFAMAEIFASAGDMREKVFKHFSKKGIDLEAQLSNALEKLKKLDGRDLAEGEGDIQDQINKALEELQAGKIIEGLQNGTTGTMPVEGVAQENPGVESITNALNGKIKIKTPASVIPE